MQELYKLSENYIKVLMELHTKVEDGKALMEKISDLMGLHQVNQPNEFKKHKIKLWFI